MRYTILTLLIFILNSNIYSQQATTTWPYLYNNFTSGTIYFTNGTQQECLVNVHILKSKLHYLEGENIKEAESSKIILVKISSDQFYIKDNKMLKVVASNDKGFIGEWATANIASLTSGGTAAYGASANSMSIRKLSSIEGNGPTATTTHMQMKNDKENGTPLSVEKSFFIVTKGYVYPANKKRLEEMLAPQKKDELKSYLKTNKISWKNPNSLIQLVDFINN